MAAKPHTLRCPFCKDVQLTLSDSRLWLGRREYVATCPKCRAQVTITWPWLRAMDAAADGPAGQHDILRRRQIVTDMPCVDCGYNLKFMKLGNRCPECGSRIRIKVPKPAESQPLRRRVTAWLIMRLVYFLVMLGAIGGMIGYINCTLIKNTPLGPL